MGRIEDLWGGLASAGPLIFLVFIFGARAFLQGVFEKDGVFLTVFCGHNTVVKCLIAVVRGTILASKKCATVLNFILLFILFFVRLWR
jgi:hypothetical protein